MSDQNSEASRMWVSPHEARAAVHSLNSCEESKRSGVWGADKCSTSRAETSNDNLASLYRPPLALMFHGSFEKDLSQFMDASPKDHHFSLSHNRSRENPHTSCSKIQDETNEDDEEMMLAKALSLGSDAVKEVSKKEKCIYPPLPEDPKGDRNSLCRVRVRLPDGRRHLYGTNEDDEEMMLAKALSLGSDAVKEVSKKEKFTYPPLPEDPKGDRNSLCRVRVRLPDGRRLQRNFLRSDPIQLLWSFCAANCGEKKQFRLTHAIPGAVKDMDYDSTLTFEESGVANSMISVTWERSLSMVQLL